MHLFVDLIKIFLEYFCLDFRTYNNFNNKNFYYKVDRILTLTNVTNYFKKRFKVFNTL